MTWTVVAVHPATVMLEADGRRIELPPDLFPTPPAPGQHWRLDATHLPSEEDRLTTLNDYLRPTS